MTVDVHDLRNTIVPKSDQLNAEQLLGAPMILTVSEVRVGGGEDQPVSVYYASDPSRPYKPCKTMRKVLILAWGPDGTRWVGKSMELYNDPSVKFGGEAVGGIRISRLTDIKKDIKVSLTATRGRKAMHEIGLLELSSELQEVLRAIDAIHDQASQKKAKALAETLTEDADLAIARNAYAKKVQELKDRAKAIDPADNPAVGSDPGPTYTQLADRLHKAKDKDAAVLIVDEARSLPQVQQSELQKAFDERWAD